VGEAGDDDRGVWRAEDGQLVVRDGRLLATMTASAGQCMASGMDTSIIA